MNKKLFYSIITIFIVVMFYFKNTITENILSVFNYTKSYINNSIFITKMKIQTYFNQAHQLQQLSKQNKEYRDYIAKISPLISNFEKLKLFKKINNPNLIFTQTISYAKLPDMSSIYINYKDKNLSTPQGLVYNNTTAGIVTKSFSNYSLAYLNNNQKVVYTVFIGKNKIPGILYGGETIKIKYIPKYHKINIDDLVVTSGLDKIFYAGVNVGKITSIKETELYQEATITPFYNTLHPTFFYVVKK